MTFLPSISFRDLKTSVERLGFRNVRQRGSHIRYVHPDSRKTTIPDHGNKDVPKGLLYKIVKRLGNDIRGFLQ